MNEHEVDTHLYADECYKDEDLNILFIDSSEIFFDELYQLTHIRQPS